MPQGPRNTQSGAFDQSWWSLLLLHAGLVGPYLAGALSKNGTDYSTPLITLGAFVLVAAVMLFGKPQQTRLHMSATIPASAALHAHRSRIHASSEQGLPECCVQ